MDDKVTLRELRERYFADRRWRDLADVLEREIKVTDDRRERLDLYEELGSVAAEHLGDAPRAFDAFRTVIDLRDDWSDDDAMGVYVQLLDLDPGFVPAFERLEPMLRARGDLDSLQELASRTIDLAGAVHDAQMFLEYQRQAARIFEVELGSPDAALMVLIASLTEENWQMGVLDDLERLARMTGDWGELTHRVAQIVAGMSDKESAVGLHKRLGFWLVGLGQLEQGADHLRRAQRRAPGDPDIEQTLGEVYRRLGRWEELLEGVRLRRGAALGAVQAREFRDEHVRMLREAAANAGDKRRQAAYLAELGNLHDQELGDRLTAVSLWEQALNAESETVAAARPLIDHYLADNRWERAAPVLETLLRAAEADREKRVAEKEERDSRLAGIPLVKAF